MEKEVKKAKEYRYTPLQAIDAYELECARDPVYRTSVWQFGEDLFNGRVGAAVWRNGTMEVVAEGPIQVWADLLSCYPGSSEAVKELREKVDGWLSEYQERLKDRAIQDFAEKEIKKVRKRTLESVLKESQALCDAVEVAEFRKRIQADIPRDETRDPSLTHLELYAVLPGGETRKLSMLFEKADDGVSAWYGFMIQMGFQEESIRKAMKEFIECEQSE